MRYGDNISGEPRLHWRHRPPFAEPHERPSPILTAACLSLIPILLAAMLVMILVIADVGDETGSHLEQLIEVLERWR